MTDVSAPGETDAATGPAPRWTLSLQEEKNEIRLGGDLRVEWKVEQPGAESTQPSAQPSPRPSCRLIEEAGGCRVEIATSAAAAWTRLVIPLDPPGADRFVTTSFLIRLTGQASGDAARLDPMISRRQTSKASRFEPVQSTRHRGKLPMEAGKWHAVTGAFLLNGAAAEDVTVCMVNLPVGATVEVARLDIDWHPTHPAGVIKSGSDENDPLPVADTAGVTVVLPFTATALPDLSGAADLASGAAIRLDAISQTLAGLPHDPSALCCALLRQADTPVGATLLSAFIRWALPGLAVLPNPLPNDLPGSLNPAEEALVLMLLRRHMSPNPDAALTQLERATLTTITHALHAGRHLGPPRRIGLTFGDGIDPEAAHWKALLASGMIATGADGEPDGGPEAPPEQTLHIAQDCLLPAMAIAYLQSVTVTAAGADIEAEVVDAQDLASWKQEIVGFTTTQAAALTHVASLGAMPGAETQTPVSLVLGQVSRRTGPGADRVTPDTAYAFILDLTPDRDLSGLVNIDKCLVFDSLAALRTALPEVTPRLRYKPVVVLTGRQRQPGHLPRCVTAHWAQAGRNVISAVVCSYNRTTGHVLMRAANGTELASLTPLRAVTSLPLGEIHSPGLDDVLFQPQEGFVLCSAAAPAPDEAELAQIEAALHPTLIPRSMHERLCLIPDVGPAAFARIDRLRNWAVAPIISEALNHKRRLASDLRSYGAAPTPARARAILDRLKPATGLTAGLAADLATDLATDIDRFLLELSHSAEQITALPSGHVLQFLKLAMSSAAVDDIAARLMLIADQICLADVAYIIPLFELLASSLSAEDLGPVLALCALGCTGAKDRVVGRISDVHRRYGSETSLAVLLSVLTRAQSGALQNPDILRHFTALLKSPLLPAVRMMTGDGLVRRLAASVEATDRFAEAVQRRDREAAVAVLRDFDAMEGVDFLRWMDSLRGLSNELKALALSVDDINKKGVDGLAWRKIAAAVFADVAVLEDLRQSGLMASPDPLNLVGLNILGDNDALNTAIAECFEHSPYSPCRIEGDSIGAVFAGAQASLPDLSESADTTLVSVIMSAFEPDLALMAAALASLQAQTHRAIEIIVVDDASSPAAAAGIRDLVAATPGARLIRLEVNSGPYVGRNLALNEARGAFVAIHDADDWAHPQLFEAQLAAFAANPEVRLVSADHIRIDRSGHVQLEMRFSVFGDGPMTSMFRRTAFDEIGPFATIRSRGDVEMRERIRSYFGNHSILPLPLPLKLCLAESATLSQRTVATTAEYLQLWRTNISSRPALGTLRSQGVRLDALHHINIPKVLRAPLPEDMS